MATQIFLSGNSIHITGANFVNTLIINPIHFDWKKTGTNYFARDGIENQSYDLGIIGEIEDEGGDPYVDEAALIAALDFLVASGGSSIDSRTKAISVISYAHHEIHSGSHYLVRDFEVIGNGASKELLIVTPDTTKWAHMIIAIQAQDGEITIELYEDSIISNSGLRNNERNRNRNFSDNNTTFVYENPIITSDGNLLAKQVFGSGKSFGGGDRDSEELLLKQNTNYLIRIINNITGNNTVDWVFDWYEHTNK